MNLAPIIGIVAYLHCWRERLYFRVARCTAKGTNCTEQRGRPAICDPLNGERKKKRITELSLAYCEHKTRRKWLTGSPIQPALTKTKAEQSAFCFMIDFNPSVPSFALVIFEIPAQKNHLFWQLDYFLFSNHWLFYGIIHIFH